jgi:hypothetical protein
MRLKMWVVVCALAVAVVAVPLWNRTPSVGPISAAQFDGMGPVPPWHDGMGPVPPWHDGMGPVPPWHDGMGPVPPWQSRG